MADRNRSHASKVETPQDDLDDILQQYGYVSNTFDHARDPYVSKQLNDGIAAQREDEGQGNGSWMIAKDQPRTTFEPPEEIRRPETAKSFASRLVEDDQRARGRISGDFDGAVADRSEKADDQQLDQIANDYDLDYETDRFVPSEKSSHGQSQS